MDGANRARMDWVPNRSTQASTVLPSGRMAGVAAWSGKPRSSGVGPAPAFVPADAALDVQVGSRLAVEIPGEGDDASVGGYSRPLVPIEHPAGRVLAHRVWGAPGLPLVLRVEIVPPLISWTDKTHHTQAAGCKARRWRA